MAAATTFYPKTNPGDEVPSLSMEINSDCPLSCPGCFLDRNKNIDQQDLSEESFTGILDHLTSQNDASELKKISIHGQEVGLVPDKLAAILKRFREIQATGKMTGTDFSFITSGINGEKVVNSLKEFSLIPDHVAVSLDGGTPESNASLRGSEKVFQPCIKGASALFNYVGSDRFTIALTLGQENISTATDIVRLMEKHGWKNLLISPQMHTDKSGQYTPSISPEEFFNTLAKFAAEMKANPELNDMHIQGLTMPDEIWSCRAMGISNPGEIKWLTETSATTGVSLRRAYSLEQVVRVRFDGLVMTGDEILESKLNKDVPNFDELKQQVATSLSAICSKMAFT